MTNITRITATIRRLAGVGIVLLATGAANNAKGGDNGSAIPGLTTQPAPRAAQAGGAKLQRVLTPLNNVHRIVPEDGRIWFATYGGVSLLDRATLQWRFFTRHDGLPANYASSLAVMDGIVYAFIAQANQVGLLDVRQDKWTVRLLGDEPQSGFWGRPWRHEHVRRDGIWCLFTGLPDSEFGPPSVIELRQYHLKTFRLLNSVDVLKLLPAPAKPDAGRGRHSPVGLALLKDQAWIATQDHLVKVDGKSWRGEVVPLPDEAVWDNVYDGHRAKQRLPNRIYSLAAGEDCLWMGMESGLAKFDPTTGKFSFLLVQENKYRAVLCVIPQGRTLWFTSGGRPFRLDPATGQVETWGEVLGSFQPMAVLEGEAWGVSGQPDRVVRVDLRSRATETIRHEEFVLPANGPHQVVLIDNVLCGWADRWARVNGKEKRLWGVQAFDLSAGKTGFHEFDHQALMVPRKDRIWLVSYGLVAPFLPLEGRLGKAVGEGAGYRMLSREPEIVARQEGKLYLQTNTYAKEGGGSYGMQVWVFDPAAGTLEMICEVPEQYRYLNATVAGVTSHHLCLAYQKDQDRFIRFNLANRTWEDVTRQGTLWDHVCEALGRTWWASHDTLLAHKAQGDAPAKKFHLPGHHINMLEALEDGRLEATTQAAVVRYDGKTWEARPLAEAGLTRAFAGMDRAGNPTGQYAVVFGGCEVVIYQGKPDPVLWAETRLAVTADPDGTIHVPVPRQDQIRNP